VRALRRFCKNVDFSRNNRQNPLAGMMTEPGKTRGAKKIEAIEPSAWRLSPRICALILCLILAVFIFIRVRLRSLPLERDEGEYAYAGQLILQGIPPYKLVYNMKLPGTYAAYAVFLLLFGQTPSGVHLGLVVVNTATTILMFFLGKRLLGEIAGLVAAAAYALLSCGTEILGLQAHATHFVVLAALAGLLLLTAERRLINLFLAGTLFGVAFVMKQPAMFFGMFAALYIAVSDWQSKQPKGKTLVRIAVLVTGAALPFAITCLVLLRCGVFARFWFWCFDYARAYVSMTPPAEGLKSLIEIVPKIIGPSVGVWALAVAGALTFGWDKPLPGRAAFCFGLLVFSFLAVCPGLYFRPHYFILMLPAVALFAALGVSTVTNILLRERRGALLAALPVVVFVGAFCYSLVAQSDIFFIKDPSAVSRSLYPGEPFDEAPVVSEYIRGNSDSGMRLVVLGSDPEIYFYSQRHSATGYIYTFPLGDDGEYAKRMEAEMMAEVEAARPEYVVLEPAGWVMPGYRGAQDRLEWVRGFVASYRLVGVVDEVSEGRSEFHWDEEARAYTPRNGLLYVFRKKT